ncbi:MAG: hypothetical protein CFH18_00586 [Alphaproteobacteria bacterium MarineAlpha5_Bin8]|nr:MAG: hypothetical protein CFH17_00240 [Alphaproteobacteria bacterium MarineAlpha5_Bin7]PPR46510.1 MAG: hypothetical protein CFH18_00586 [Alphaproteobacteria bacterium MarineAlpha5_Bin8]PPR53198.1 MAG: hypothetical protein CFH16_01136 [Alphaproteobacteria bacterium MarineAlpha5_Bin6]|tara:strand:- start:4841 stop:6118 length:1278 start_codon:yes stop_codon:yes gene_type:complete
MKKSIIVAILILLLVIGWFLSGRFFNSSKYQSENFSKTNQESENINKDIENLNQIIVETNVSKFETIDQSIILQGQTISNRSIDIKAQTTGNVIKKSFKRGDNLKKDDILIKISMEDRNELLNSLKKEFSKFKKEIILVKETKENNIIKTNEQIKLYDEQIKVYQIEYNTAKELVDKGLGSESKLNIASFNLTQAKTNLTQAKTNLNEIDINYKTQSINLESQLENVKSKIKNIELDINNTIIKTPFNGIIQTSYVEEGDFIRPGDIIANIVDLNPIKIQGYLSESDINKINIGTNAIIMISNSLKKEGKITFISPVAETNTRTFEFIIEAENNDLLFKSGLTTSITINVDSVKAHKISPSILTLKDDGTVGIKALNEKNKVVFYSIENVKDTVDGMWVKGLPEEVTIITSGQEYVNEGQVIETK